MSVDIGNTIAPNSDQLDAVDLLTGPRTFTIERVSKGEAEQPVNIHLAEFPRPWRPGKSMRRVLVACWGVDTSTYIGRRLTLWCDPAVRFGGAEVGGVRILKLSNIDKPRTIPLLVSRGKSAPYRVEPLPDDTPAQFLAFGATLDGLYAQFARLGIPEADQLKGVKHYTGATAGTIEAITEDQAQKMIGILQQRPDPEAEQYASGSAVYDPAAEPASWAPTGGKS